MRPLSEQYRPDDLGQARYGSLRTKSTTGDALQSSSLNRVVSPVDVRLAAKVSGKVTTWVVKRSKTARQRLLPSLETPILYIRDRLRTSSAKGSQE